jgi:hypothetical protein
MRELILVIAGEMMAIKADQETGFLLKPLQDLFRGFLKKKSRYNENPVTISLYYEHFVTLRKFKAEPVSLSTKKDMETTRIINHVSRRYPVSEKTLLVGFFNGVLAYNVPSREAHIFLFRSKGKNLLIGSLYKLLFVFTAMLMAEQKKLLVHGAGLRIHSQGNLFIGGSGAGKTTVAGYVQTEDVLSDDATVVEKSGGRFRIHPSPFSQVNMGEKKAANHHLKKATLKRIVFLKKGGSLALNPRERNSALAELLLLHIHYFALMDRELKTDVFSFCADLCASIPSFDLYFQKNDGFLSLL